METTGVHLWLVLWKAYQALLCHAEHHIHSLGLGFSDFAVLEVLLHKGPAPVNRIGELVHLTSGSITAAIDRLERKSLVARGADGGRDQWALRRRAGRGSGAAEEVGAECTGAVKHPG